MSTGELGQSQVVAKPKSGMPTVFRRRRFVSDLRYQLRASFLSIAIVVTLLILLNLTVFMLARTTTEAFVEQAPTLEASLKARDAARQLWLAGFSVAFLGIFLFVRLLETHKTAGATWRLKKSIDALSGGHLDTPLFLRKHDNLQDLLQHLKSHATALRVRAEQEAAELEQLAIQLERDPATLHSVAQSLRKHSETKREQLSSRAF